MLKKILIAVICLVLVLAVIGFLLPRMVHVERSLTIARPASLVYATVNSFQQFAKWSPWQDLDPHMTQTTEGAREGVGAKLVWHGNDKVGSGTQVITASVPNVSVTSDVDFGSMGVAKSSLLLAPEASATRVTWNLDTDMGAGPVGRYFGLAMDRMIGKDYETGLAKLKKLVESMPDTDIAGFSVERVQLTAQPILAVTKTTGTDTASISQAYGAAYGEIGKFMAKNKLHQVGAPLGIDGAMTATSFTFDAAIAVDRGDVAGTDTMKVGRSYAGSALKTVHVGPYHTLRGTYEKFRAYLAAHAYTPAGASFSSFLDDPTAVPEDKLRTEIYFPVE